MTRRVIVLGLLLTRSLFRTLLGMLPPALTLLVYRLTFTYRDQGDPNYLTAVGGLGLAFVCVITALLVCDRANRAAIYPLIAKLPHRTELIAAVIVSIVLITLLMAGLYVGCVIVFQNMLVTSSMLLLIAPRWLAVFFLAATLGVLMSKLTSRNGSHLIAWGGLGALVLARERAIMFNVPGIITSTIDLIARPITDALTLPLENFSIPGSSVLTLFYASGLFCIAVWLFRRKDLLWME